LRSLALRFAFLLLVIAVVSSGVFVWGYGQFMRPGPLTTETALVIPKGAGVAAIAGQLAAAGVIQRPLIFRVGVRLFGRDRGLQAGEYLFPATVAPKDAMQIILSGKTVVRKLTVAEGLTTDEIFALVAGAGGLKGLPGPRPAEGALLPETYHFAFGDSREEIIGRMTRAMKETLDTLWRSRAPDGMLESPAEALVLASIIEKETAVAAERPHIAGVFFNRFRRGMKLQSDPTVAYGIGLEDGPLDRPLTRADLKRPTPFNTYLNGGLPPAPICNPGRASIEAALNPIKTDDFYFVADGTGGHVFAKTLKAHNRNVAKWRKMNNGR